MISKAEIIDQPYSGQFTERIYDISSPWNSSNWTWVKFEEEDYNEWYGEFRGSPRAAALSKKYNKILVLTSDYLFEVDCKTGEYTGYESHTQYQSLTVTPLGDFIIADYYNIEKIGPTLNDNTPLISPIEMDFIKFNGWSNGKLLITCEEYQNWINQVELELDGVSLEITLKSVK